MRLIRSVLAVVSLVLLATAALAQEPPAIKPPIRGLISMGAYKFVGAKLKPPGCTPAPQCRQPQPVNTLRPLDQYRGLFGGLVVVASWAQLEPEQGKYDFTVIDEALAQVAAYNASQLPLARPLYVKLRVWGGFMAPDWAKAIGGGAITVHHKTRERTIGRFWLQDYRDAFSALNAALARKYDDNIWIREVAVTQCMAVTAEPFFLPADIVTPLKALWPNPLTDAAYQDCLMNAVGNYGDAWQTTRIVYPFNPYRTDGPADAEFTVRVMRHCRAALGQRCVFDNHDLVNPLLPSIAPVYRAMTAQGPAIEFQTYTPNPQYFAQTILLGVALGASGIELYQDYGGFPCLPKATVAQFADWMDGKRLGETPLHAPICAEVILPEVARRR